MKLQFLFPCLFIWIIQGVLNNTWGQTTGQSYELNPVKKRFVHLPVKTGAGKSWMTVYAEGEWQHEFEIELAPGIPDFYASVEVGSWKGKKLVLTAEKSLPGSQWMERIKVSNQLADKKYVYREKYRPQFHFSPRRGWTNDPNGLVFYKGLYHLFFQHNPYETSWGNMTWGHAVSKDLLHWKELSDAVLPDKNGVAFSGSAVVDWENSSGLQEHPSWDNHGKLKNPPLVAFYTSTLADRGKGKAAQSVAYSTDEGMSWRKFSGNPVIPHITGGNRDPKVFHYVDRNDPLNPSNGRWIMALYMEGQDYALFSSENLLHWEKICDIKKLGCSECPDMFELPVDGSSQESRWVFWGGNGNYLTGYFNGREFLREGGPFNSKYGGNDYAAQTYSEIPSTDGRRIMFSWMQGGKYPGMPFNQQFSVPRNLTLRKTAGGIRLFMEPVKELENLRFPKPVSFTVPLKGPGKPTEVPGLKGELYDIELVARLNPSLALDASGVMNITVCGQKISYHPADSIIDLEGIKAPFNPEENIIKCRIIVDRTSIEIFANDGIIQIARCFVKNDASPGGIIISGKEGMAEVEVKVHRLKSVWRKL